MQEIKDIKVVKVIETIDEYNESAEFKALWSGFVMQKERNHSTNIFKKALVCEDGSIYVLRQMVGTKDAGLTLLLRASTCSILDNSPFRVGWYSEVSGAIRISMTHAYARHMQARVALAKHCQSVDWDVFVTTEF